jgi:hypothetical protein
LPATALERAVLWAAHLERANFGGGVNLGDVTLLGGAKLAAAHLKGAKANDETVWPDGFDWKAAGVVMDPGKLGPAHIAPPV